MAVESLRAKGKQSPSGEITTISAADHLNLTGIMVPGERVPAISGKVVEFRDGATIGADERATERMNVLPMRLAR
jgi:ATP-dependent Lhr-like helicase